MFALLHFPRCEMRRVWRHSAALRPLFLCPGFSAVDYLQQNRIGPSARQRASSHSSFDSPCGRQGCLRESRNLLLCSPVWSVMLLGSYTRKPAPPCPLTIRGRPRPFSQKHVPTKDYEFMDHSTPGPSAALVLVERLAK